MTQNEKDTQNQHGPPSSTRPPDARRPAGPRNDNDGNKPSDSLLNRIQSSATALARDAITRPSGQGLGADLASALSSDGKPSSSSSRWPMQSSGAAGGASASAMDTAFPGSGTGSGVRDSAVTESFRSSSRVPVDGTFNLDAINREHFQNDYGDEPLFADKGKGKARSTTGDANLSTSAYDGAWYNATTTVSDARHDKGNEQTNTYIPNAEDGAAVVSLLSDPSFQPELLPDDPDQFLDDPVAPLTSEEQRIIDSFRRSIQPPLPLETQTQGQQPSRPITSQSLIPDIDTFLSQHNEGDANTTSVTALRDSVLASLPGAEEWMAVDERYQDEVWGYLRPALEAAEKELEERKYGGGEPGRDGPAVRRLKMILRHMQPVTAD